MSFPESNPCRAFSPAESGLVSRPSLRSALNNPHQSSIIDLSEIQPIDNHHAAHCPSCVSTERAIPLRPEEDNEAMRQSRSVADFFYSACLGREVELPVHPSSPQYQCRRQAKDHVRSHQDKGCRTPILQLGVQESRCRLEQAVRLSCTQYQSHLF